MAAGWDPKTGEWAGEKKGEQVKIFLKLGEGHSQRGFFGRSKRGCQKGKKEFFFCSGPEARGRAQNGGFWEVEKLREICGKKPRYGHEFYLFIFFSFLVFVSLHYFYWDNP